MIFRGIHEFVEFLMLKRFWSILALKKCCANWPNAMGKRVKVFKNFLYKKSLNSKVCTVAVIFFPTKNSSHVCLQIRELEIVFKMYIY